MSLLQKRQEINSYIENFYQRMSDDYGVSIPGNSSCHEEFITIPADEVAAFRQTSIYRRHQLYRKRENLMKEAAKFTGLRSRSRKLMSYTSNLRIPLRKEKDVVPSSYSARETVISDRKPSFTRSIYSRNEAMHLNMLVDKVSASRMIWENNSTTEAVSSGLSFQQDNSTESDKNLFVMNFNNSSGVGTNDMHYARSCSSRTSTASLDRCSSTTSRQSPTPKLISNFHFRNKYSDFLIQHHKKYTCNNMDCVREGFNEKFEQEPAPSICENIFHETTMDDSQHEDMMMKLVQCLKKLQQDTSKPMASTKSHRTNQKHPTSFSSNYSSVKPETVDDEPLTEEFSPDEYEKDKCVIGPLGDLQQSNTKLQNSSLSAKGELYNKFSNQLVNNVAMNGSENVNQSLMTLKLGPGERNHAIQQKTPTQPMASNSAMGDFQTSENLSQTVNLTSYNTKKYISAEAMPPSTISIEDTRPDNCEISLSLSQSMNHANTKLECNSVCSSKVEAVSRLDEAEHSDAMIDSLQKTPSSDMKISARENSSEENSMEMVGPPSTSASLIANEIMKLMLPLGVCPQIIKDVHSVFSSLNSASSCHQHKSQSRSRRAKEKVVADTNESNRCDLHSSLSSSQTRHSSVRSLPYSRLSFSSPLEKIQEGKLLTFSNHRQRSATPSICGMTSSKMRTVSHQALSRTSLESLVTPYKNVSAAQAGQMKFKKQSSNKKLLSN